MTHSNTMKRLNRQLNKTPFGIQFAPEHFPVGTVFRIGSSALFKDYETGETGPDTYTVAEGGVHQNGVDSYVLLTGQMQKISEHYFERMFNIAHVVEIIKRGDGPMRLDFGMRQPDWQKRIRDDVERMRITKPHGEWKPKKGFHTTGSLSCYLALELERVVQSHMLVDHDRLTTAIMAQTWVKKPLIGKSKHHWFMMLNKKRLRAWLKTNINRFLMQKKEGVRFEDQLQQEQVEQDWDYDDPDEDRNLTLPSEFLTNFDLYQLEAYQKAVLEFPLLEFEVRETDCDGKPGNGSLWIYSERVDLSSFWARFDEIKHELNRRDAEAAAKDTSFTTQE